MKNAFFKTSYQGFAIIKPKQSDNYQVFRKSTSELVGRSANLRQAFLIAYNNQGL